MKRRDLSRRERGMVEEAITRVCRAIPVDERDPDFRQRGWEAILSVYRSDPGGFSPGEPRGWHRAYRLAWDAILRERDAVWRLLYQERSLDAPLSPGGETPLGRLLHLPHGGFEGSVCFSDFLDRLPRDLRRMAFGMMEGDTLAELRGCYHWSWDHAYRTFNQLRQAVEEYEGI